MRPSLYNIVSFADPVTGEVWRSERAFIYWLFNGRCIVCKMQATEINHIDPKSRRQENFGWRNQVTMCQKCHEKYHKDGVTDDKIEDILARRKAFLISLGRSKYV